MHDDVISPAGFHMRNRRVQLHFSAWILTLGLKEPVPNLLNNRINKLATGRIISEDAAIRVSGNGIRNQATQCPAYLGNSLTFP